MVISGFLYLLSKRQKIIKIYQFRTSFNETEYVANALLCKSCTNFAYRFGLFFIGLFPEIAAINSSDISEIISISVFSLQKAFLFLEGHLKLFCKHLISPGFELRTFSTYDANTLTTKLPRWSKNMYANLLVIYKSKHEIEVN